MSTVTKPVQEQEGAQDQRIKSDWKTLVEKVSYKAIVNNIPFLAFVALLCVLYIHNSQRAVEMQRDLNRQNKILKELRWRYMDVSTQLMYTQIEAEVIRKAAVLGLNPIQLPAYTVQLDSSDLKP
jgi:hypothetical protein